MRKRIEPIKGRQKQRKVQYGMRRDFTRDLHAQQQADEANKPAAST